jgi:hypothetical protein
MPTATTRYVAVYVDGMQAIDTTLTAQTKHSGTPLIYMGGDNAAPEYLDNFIFATATPKLAAGTFDTTTTTLTQTFNADNQLAALNFTADYLDWEYRVNPKAGAGNDTLDFGASLGFDYTADANRMLVLEEGKNISGLSKSRASDQLATSLYVYGQSADEGSSNSIVYNFDGIDTYGIIESDYNDQRIVDNATARLIGANRLAISAAGNVSLSGRILDESQIFEQNPMIGYILIGDAVIGGRQRYLRPGDYVWLKSPKLNIDQRVRVVALTRSSGNPVLDVTFDYFPWRRGDEIRRLRNQLSLLNRAFLNRLNAQNIRLTFASTSTQTWYLYLRGQIKTTLIDVRIAAGTPTYKVFIDTVDVTTALFGASTRTTDSHAEDSTYLIYAGDHTLGIQVTSSTGTFDVAISTRALS